MDFGQVEDEKPSSVLPLVRTSKSRITKSVKTKQSPKDTKERKIKKKKKRKPPQFFEEPKLEDVEVLVARGHIVRSQSGLCTQAYMLPQGKYEVEVATHPSPSVLGNEVWYIVKKFKPNRTIGNTILMFSHWFGVSGQEQIKKTIEDGRIFLETFGNFWVKEIIQDEE